eukprot:1156602-Pelagomonas_calceolata.AAC.4
MEGRVCKTTRGASSSQHKAPDSHASRLQPNAAELVDLGFVRPSSSTFASPVLLVKKADGSWRMCVDYRGMNAATRKNSYPMQKLMSCLSNLQGKYFRSWKEKEKEKKKLCRQRKLSLHQLRKRRHISSKSRESPSPKLETSTQATGRLKWRRQTDTRLPSEGCEMSHEVFRDLLDKGAVLEFILMMSLSMALMRPLICVYLTRCCKDYMRTKQLCCKSFAKASKCQFLESEI